VSFELHNVRGVPCTLVEPRPRKLNRMQHKWLKKRRQRESKGEEAGGGAGSAMVDDDAAVVKVYEARTAVAGEAAGAEAAGAEAAGAAVGATAANTTTLGTATGAVPCVQRGDPSPLEATGVLCAQVQTEFTPENWHLFADCSVVVGMHPDQATEVGAVHVWEISVDPWLKTAWFQPLNLKCWSKNLLVSKFAFKLNLYRYAAFKLNLYATRRLSSTLPRNIASPSRWCRAACFPFCFRIAPCRPRRGKEAAAAAQTRRRMHFPPTRCW
jgi:hypothetical protein